jgi:hypothetical protein
LRIGIPLAGELGGTRGAALLAIAGKSSTGYCGTNAMSDELDEIQEAADRVNLHPSLAPLVQEHQLQASRLTVAIRVSNQIPEMMPRNEVLLSDGEKGLVWHVDSLRALFRGDRQPPRMQSEPPPAYMPYFYFIEQHVLTFGDAMGDKTDGEFEEAFSNLRRRPDGKPLSDLHNFLWQVAACLVGKYEFSAAEFDAVFGRLARSASTFRIGLVSRNYTGTLRLTMRT